MFLHRHNWWYTSVNNTVVRSCKGCPRSEQWVTELINTGMEKIGYWLKEPTHD
jgi:hypothetical protein